MKYIFGESIPCLLPNEMKTGALQEITNGKNYEP